MRYTFLAALTQLAKSNPNIILMTGDLGFGTLREFTQSFPQNCIINAGISEQNMMSAAAGLALSGKTVFVYSIANFVTLRCLEQLRNSAAYHEADVKVVAIGAGVGYGAMGPTHHATEDISVLRAVPGITVFSPSDSEEARVATFAAAEKKGCCYLRLSRGVPDLASLSQTGESVNDIFRARKICDGGSDLCIFATGAVAETALQAAADLNAPLFTFATVKPIDTEFIRQAASIYKTILTFEENQIQGGFGGAVCEIVAALPGQRANVQRIGFDNTFARRTGSREWIMEAYGISAAQAARLYKEENYQVSR